MLTGFLYPTPSTQVMKRGEYSPSDDMVRLLAAAVINRKFRDLLLRHPGRALARGFQGERFSLDDQEKKMVLSIQADSLSEFASQITSYQEGRIQRRKTPWIPSRQNALVLEA